MKSTLLVFGLLGLLPACVLAADPAPAAPIGTESRPLKVIETDQGHFPEMLLDRGVRYGMASLIVAVNASGELTDVLVTAYSHEPFAREAQRVARQWKFEPALERGQPVGALVNIDFSFEVRGVLVIDRKDIDVEHRESEWSDQPVYQPMAAHQLDAVPRPVKVVAPTYPQEWAEQGIAGLLTVDFYIDESGRPRMATCAPGSDPQLAGIALAAVEQWQFSPPTAQGKPVLVHARQQFSFGRKT
jgi:TonB family protein